MVKNLQTIRLARDPNWRYKLIISVAFGLIGFFGSFFSIQFSYGDVNITMNWSLVFPVLIAHAWGRRYGQISVCLGLAAFYPFLIGLYNGWACFVTSFVLFAWVTIIGWGRDKRFSEKKLYTNTYFLQLVYSGLRIALYFTAFPLLYMLNPPFWYPAANTSIALSTIAVFAVKSFIIDFLLLAVADVLLLIPTVRRLLRLECPKYMRYNTKIILLIFVLVIFFRAIIITSDYFLVQKDYSLSWLTHLPPGDMILLMWAAFAGLIIGGIIVRIFNAHLETKESLEESEKKYREIFNDFNDIYMETDATRVIRTVTPSIERILGYKPEDLIGTGVTDLLIEPAAHEQLVEQLRLYTTIGNIQMAMYDTAQVKHDFLLNMERIETENGEERIIGIAREVTQYIKTEDKLKAAEKKYSLLFNTLINAIVIIEPVYDEIDQLVDYRYVDANAAYEKYSGRQKHEVLGRTFSEIHGMRNRYLESYEKLFKTGESQRFISHQPKNHDAFDLVHAFRYGDSQGVLLFDTITDRIQMERELRRVSDNLTAIIESTDDMIWSVDRSYALIQYNSALKDYIKESYGRHLQPGMRLYEMMDEEKARYWIDIFDRAVRDGALRLDIPTKDGEKLYAVAIYPLFRDGELSEISVFEKDITHRIEMEQEIKRVSDNLTAILESTDDLIWSVDSNFEIVQYNTALSRYVMESDGKEVQPGLRMHELMDEKRAVFWNGLYERAMMEGKYKIDIPTKYGDRFYSVSLYPIYKEGDISVISIFAKDISHRLEMENALKQASANLTAIIESTDDMIWSVDSNYAIVYYNTALKRYIEGSYGTSVKAGRQLQELMDADRAAFWTEQLDCAVQKGQYKFDIATKHGNKTLTVSLNPIYKDGALREISIFEKDITQRVRMEQEILQLNAELEKRVEERTTELQNALAELESFTYTVSHDLKSPLRTIEAYSGILLEDSPGDDRLAAASHIRHISNDMLSFIGKLLQYATAARYEISVETIDLFEMIRSEFNELTQVSGRTIELLIDDDIPPVKADRFLIKQVLANILSNAVKFTKTREHAVITVTCDISGPEIVLCIADNGVGFDMHESHKLFRMFQRLHPSHEFEGTGIGLATVKKLILKLGGRTWIEGEPGNGAAVYISLPLI